MPAIDVNGVLLYYEIHGQGEPLALVHGSWADARTWELVAPALAESFQVLIYDRRGHSRSERPATPGSVSEDADDLAALLEELDLAPAHVVTNSFGGNIALRLATRRPDLFRTLSCHEPPLWSVISADAESQTMLQHGADTVAAVVSRLADGDNEGGARQFIDEVVFGPGAWDSLPAGMRAIFTTNAPTFLDECGDPEQYYADQEALRRLGLAVRLTDGTASPSLFPRVVGRLRALIPRTTHETIPGAGHLPHLTGPQRYLEVTRRGLPHQRS